MGRALIFILLLLGAAWAADTQRVVMVLEAKGGAMAGKQPLRTLQVLPASQRIAVAAGATLRLTYFASGRRETITGPKTLTTGAQESLRVSGTGKLVAESTTGARTLVPKSENLRRMGGARHAMAEMDAEQLVALLPPRRIPAPITGPGPDRRTPTNSYISRPSRPLTLTPHAPSVLDVTKAQDWSWQGGKAPLSITLASAGESKTWEENGAAGAISLSDLVPGRVYTLTVRDFENVTKQDELYILTAEEAAEVRGDLAALAEESPDKLEQLGAQIAYLENRGLWWEALLLAEQAYELAPDDAGLATALGRLQIRMGQPEEARLTLEKAMELEK